MEHHCHQKFHDYMLEASPPLELAWYGSYRTSTQKLSVYFFVPLLAQ